MNKQNPQNSGNPFAVLAIVGSLLLVGGIVGAATSTFSVDTTETTSQEAQPAQTTELPPQSTDKRPVDTMQPKLPPETDTDDNKRSTAPETHVNGLQDEKRQSGTERENSDANKSQLSEFVKKLLSRFNNSPPAAQPDGKNPVGN